MLLLDAARKGAGIYGPATDKWAEAVQGWEPDFAAKALTGEVFKAYWSQLSAKKYDGPNTFTNWFAGSRFAPGNDKPASVAVPKPTDPGVLAAEGFARLPPEQQAPWLARAKAQHPGVPIGVQRNSAARLWAAKQGAGA